MTRINCIPPSELHSKHLVAEYRELPRVFALARTDKPNELPVPFYVLGPGHVRFFYDKLGFLFKRQHQICEEMERRGMKVNFPAQGLYDNWYHIKPHLWGYWRPTKEAMRINRKRIKERLENGSSSLS